MNKTAQKRQNPGRTARFSKRRNALALLGIALSAGGALAMPPTLAVRLLPNGPTGTGSRAACAAVWDDADTVHVIVAGQVRDNGGTWRPAAWVQTARTVSPPFTVADLGRGGAINGVDTFAATDGLSNTIMFAGSVSNLMGLLLPAVWAAKGGGEVAMEELTLSFLSTPQTYGGEALGVTVATGDVNGDGVVDGADFVSWGRVTAPNGKRFAAVWVSGQDGNDTLTVLPSLVPGGESSANCLSVKLENTMISGFAYDAGGRMQAVTWNRVNGQWQPPVVLGNLPGGNRSNARTETVDNNETVTIGGSARSSDGRDLPMLWFDFDNDGDVDGTDLVVPAGYGGGRVNSIIAILIGLFSAGRVDGPTGSHACIWIDQGEIPTACVDLNAIARNLPAGATLTEANCILPYMEQSNLYKLAGNGVDAQGNPRGWVGTLTWFVPDMDSDQSGMAVAGDIP